MHIVGENVPIRERSEKKMFCEIKNRFQGSIEATVVRYYGSMFFNMKFCWYNHFASAVRTDTYLYIITQILHAM